MHPLKINTNSLKICYIFVSFDSNGQTNIKYICIGIVSNKNIIAWPNLFSLKNISKKTYKILLKKNRGWYSKARYFFFNSAKSSKCKEKEGGDHFFESLTLKML